MEGTEKVHDKKRQKVIKQKFKLNALRTGCTEFWKTKTHTS